MTLLPMKPIKCLTTIMSLGIYRVSNTPFRLVWSFTPLHLIHLSVYVHTPAPWGLDLHPSALSSVVGFCWQLLNSTDSLPLVSNQRQFTDAAYSKVRLSEAYISSNVFSR